MYNLYNMKSCCTYCANRSYFVHKSVQQLRIFQGFLFYCSVLLQIVQNLTVLYGVLCNILKDPFFLKSAFEMQMVTRNFGLMFAAPSLRKTQGSFLKHLWKGLKLHHDCKMAPREHGYQHCCTRSIAIATSTPNWQIQ